MRGVRSIFDDVRTSAASAGAAAGAVVHLARFSALFRALVNLAKDTKVENHHDNARDPEGDDR